MVVWTYNFWGCKDTHLDPDKEKNVGKIRFFVEKQPFRGSPGGNLGHFLVNHVNGKDDFPPITAPARLHIGL
jgi:hypothetical protein